MTSLVQPAIVTAAAAARLRDADEALSRKLDATTVQVAIGGRGNTVARSTFAAAERRVLGLVRAAAEHDRRTGPGAAAGRQCVVPRAEQVRRARQRGVRAARLRRHVRRGTGLAGGDVAPRHAGPVHVARAGADVDVRQRRGRPRHRRRRRSRGGGAPRRGVHDGARERPRLPHRRRPRAALGVRPSHVETVDAHPTSRLQRRQRRRRTAPADRRDRPGRLVHELVAERRAGRSAARQLPCRARRHLPPRGSPRPGARGGRRSRRRSPIAARRSRRTG